MRAAGLFAFATLLSGCGSVFPSMKAHTEVADRTTELAKAVEQQRQEILTLREDLEAARTRLDNALRVQADSSSEQLGDRAKLQNIEARVDSQTEALEQVKKDVAAARRELDVRLDELKRAQEAPGKAPPTIPTDKAGHYASLEAAYKAQDYNLARTLGREYAARYATDELADDALFLVGEAFMKEGRPASALGELNQLLKLYPKSNQLGPTLFTMGEAYLALRDCTNAKLAFSACEARFKKDALGAQARQRLAQIAKPAPGMCSP